MGYDQITSREFEQAWRAMYGLPRLPPTILERISGYLTRPLWRLYYWIMRTFSL